MGALAFLYIYYLPMYINIPLHAMILSIHWIFGQYAYNHICMCQRGSWEYCVYWALSTSAFIFNVSVKIFYSPSLFVSEWIVTFFMICELIIAYLTACNDYAVCIPWMFSWGGHFTELMALWMVFSTPHLLGFFVLQRIALIYKPDAMEVLVEIVFYAIIFVEFMLPLSIMFHTDAQIQYGDGRRRKLLPFVFIMLILIVIGTASRAAVITYSKKHMQTEEGKLLFGFITGVLLQTALNVVISWIRL